MMYLPIFNIDCAECGTTPVVGLITELNLHNTNLCGVCFFHGDRMMVDPEEWNEHPESTE